MVIEGKIALVTGAGDGIGKALVDELAARGVTCIAVSRSIEQNREGSIVQARCDIRNNQDVKDIADYVENNFGELSILINCAGIWHKSLAIDEIDDDIMSDVIETNLIGTMRVTKYLLPLLRRADNAALVNIISNAGLKAQAGRCAYAASKFGVRGFTEATREDLRGTSVRVLSVYQGGTATRFFEKAFDPKQTDNYIDPRDLAKLIVDAIAAPNKLWQSELRVDHT